MEVILVGVSRCEINYWPFFGRLGFGASVNQVYETTGSDHPQNHKREVQSQG